MECIRKIIGKRRLLLGAVTIPVFLWALIVAVIPTDWARDRIARRLSQVIDQPVTLGRVRVGPLGGVIVEDLRIGVRESTDAPWLNADSMSFDLNLPQVLMGQCLPTHVRVDGLELIYHRGPDGACPIATALFAKKPADDPSWTDGGGHAPRGNIEVVIQAGRIQLIDDPSGTKLELTSIDGKVVCEPERISVESLTAKLDGGDVDLVAHFDRTMLSTGVEGHIRGQGVKVDGDWHGLALVVPILGSAGNALEGAMDFSVYVRGQGQNAEELNKNLVGKGFVKLDPVCLDGTKLLDELIPTHPGEKRVGAIHSEFEISDQRVTSKNLTVDVGAFPIVLAGWTSFDGAVDYRIKSDGLTSQIRGKLGDLAELVEEAADIRVTGTLDDLSLTSGGKPITRQDSREKLKKLSKGLRERILR